MTRGWPNRAQFFSCSLFCWDRCVQSRPPRLKDLLDSPLFLFQTSWLLAAADDPLHGLVGLRRWSEGVKGGLLYFLEEKSDRFLRVDGSLAETRAQGQSQSRAPTRNPFPLSTPPVSFSPRSPTNRVRHLVARIPEAAATFVSSRGQLSCKSAREPLASSLPSSSSDDPPTPSVLLTTGS